jgi:hypothetical protein
MAQVLDFKCTSIVLMQPHQSKPSSMHTHIPMLYQHSRTWSQGLPGHKVCTRKDPPGTIPGVRRHYAFDFARVDPRLLYTFYLVFTKHPISSTSNPTLLDIRHVSPSRHQSRCLYKSCRLRDLAFLNCIPPFYSTSSTIPLSIYHRREYQSEVHTPVADALAYSHTFPRCLLTSRTYSSR